MSDNASGNHPHSGPFVEILAAARARRQGKLSKCIVATSDFIELQAEVAVEIELMIRKIDLLGALERRIETLYLAPQA